ncbi:hypothetical protein MRB53_042160 [Persea americana]|nr:hypothetical protein MRB53_042160 [Persea americana]
MEPPRKRRRSETDEEPEDNAASKKSRPLNDAQALGEELPAAPSSPPRKRPGAAARISKDSQELARQRQKQREELAKEAVTKGVSDVVKQHYNAVPQRGKEWRKTDSKIKGLRSFNNWVKSATIQKFASNGSYPEPARPPLLVLDIGCGKGGDLQKWQAADVELYVGLDPADVSIRQAAERYAQMKHAGRHGRRGPTPPLFHAEFIIKDCFGEWIGDIPIIQEAGIDGSVGPGMKGFTKRFGGGGFDVVSMMFCMHYAFESEEKARMMLRNVAGSLKKGGRFIGTIPNSDVLSAKVKEHLALKGAVQIDGGDDDDDDWDPEKPAETVIDRTEDVPAQHDDEKDALEWGNEIYRVKFPGKVPSDGVFRPPFGWKYFYFLEEAVEEIPEYVVPWEAFRALAADYDLELQYRKPFNEVWDLEKDDIVLGPLSERMGVRGRNRGPLLVSDVELDAASFYHAFCFYKT